MLLTGLILGLCILFGCLAVIYGMAFESLPELIIGFLVLVVTFTLIIIIFGQ